MTCRPMTCRPLTCRPMTCRPLTCRPMTCRPMTWRPRTWSRMTRYPLTRLVRKYFDLEDYPSLWPDPHMISYVFLRLQSLICNSYFRGVDFDYHPHVTKTYILYWFFDEKNWKTVWWWKTFHHHQIMYVISQKKSMTEDEEYERIRRKSQIAQSKRTIDRCREGMRLFLTNEINTRWSRSFSFWRGFENYTASYRGSVIIT